MPALQSYALPQAQASGVRAFWIWVVLMAALVGIFYAIEALRTLAWVVLLWWAVSAIVVFWVMPATELRTLRSRGVEYSINARQHPRLKTLLSKGSVMVGVREPEGYVRGGNELLVHMAGRAPVYLVVGQGALNELPPPELDCLTLRALVQNSLGQTTRVDALRHMSAMSKLLRLAVWPLGLYASLLRAMWQAPAESSADRLTLLLVKNPKLLMSALVKEFVSSQSALQTQGVTLAEAENYVRQGGLISNTGEQISSQFRIGIAIRENAAFDARLRALTRYINSPEYVGGARTVIGQKSRLNPLNEMTSDAPKRR
jgi:hypothetical protein